uniref:Uncharacterized protein n=1 Tax=Alexandrium catenella TaxID=2925 RepID=A0A7S1LXS8_ALECA
MQGCLASSPCGRRPCLRVDLCAKDEEVPRPTAVARGGDAFSHEVAAGQLRAAPTPPAAPRLQPPAPRPAPVLRGPGEVMDARTERQEAEGERGERQEQRPAVSRHSSPEAAPHLATWRYEPEDGLHVDVRSAPDVGAQRTGGFLRAGEVFQVSEEREGAEGVLYLRLADGDGWVFDRKPGIGPLCARVQPAPSVEEARPPPRRQVPAPLQEVAAEEVPADARETGEMAAGSSQGSRFWPLAGPFLPQATGQPLLQMATQFAAQTAKDHNPGAVQWPRSSSARLSGSWRYGGA